MTHHHFSKTHCSNDDVMLSNTYGHLPPPLFSSFSYDYAFSFAKLLFVVAVSQHLYENGAAKPMVKAAGEIRLNEKSAVVKAHTCF